MALSFRVPTRLVVRTAHIVVSQGIIARDIVDIDTRDKKLLNEYAIKPSYIASKWNLLLS